ncbi:MAG: hypothetical protein Q7R97_00585 [Candidatus Daviesbacteria bacterium]|nr:hypothetical protein [Candidatus Daviesbacteria bacterium]
MKIRVVYSLLIDTNIYMNSIYQFAWLKHGREDMQKKLLSKYPIDFQEQLQSAKNTKQAKVIIRKYLKNNYKNNQLLYKQSAKLLTKVWKKEEKKIIEQLETLFNNKFPFEKITIFFTTAPICPYNYNKRWIAVVCKATPEIQINILKHELNHFMFYFYYSELKMTLTTEKFESLKESLTVFTNPEEQGYPNHQKLRAWLKSQKSPIPEILKSSEWEEYIGI